MTTIRRVSQNQPFGDLKPTFRRHQAEIEAAVARVLASGWYVLGPEVERLEADLAAYAGRAHAVAVANGTDAIELALRANGIGRGDEVVTVGHTAVATVAAIEATGAKPVLVDIEEDHYTMLPAALDAAIGPRTAAVVPVHIYGQAADMDAIGASAARHRLLVVEDCAQALGARLAGRRAGAFGDAATLSFYPTKTLGAFGDAGAVLTDDAAVAARLKRLRSYGRSDRYVHAERGINSRMDEIQGAILRVLLGHLDEANRERQALAGRYRAGLRSMPAPAVREGAEHVYHLFVVRAVDRDRFRAGLQEEGVSTLVHYPVPVHLQPAYADLGLPAGSLPVTERVAAEVVSLPLYPGLEPAAVDRVAAAVEAS